MKSQCFGSKPVVSTTLLMLDPHWNSSWISWCCPVLWRFYSFGSAGLVILHVATDHKRSGYWGRATWILGLSRCRVGHQLLLVLITRMSCPVLSWQVHPLQWWARDRAGAPAFMSSELDLPHYTFRASFAVLPRCGIGAIVLLSAAADGSRTGSPFLVPPSPPFPSSLTFFLCFCFVFLRQGFTVALKPALELALVDKAGIKLPKLHLPLPPGCWV